MSTDGARLLSAGSDPGVRRQLQKRLRGIEVTSDCADDGHAAVQMLRDHSYCVVLIDLDLPDVSAERILTSIGEVNASARPVVLVLAGANTARSLDVDLIQIVLRKPCNIGLVADLVRSCVDGGRWSAAGPINAGGLRPQPIH